jgi:hypothetical protein
MATPFGPLSQGRTLSALVTADEPSTASDVRFGRPLRVAVSLAGDFRLGLLISGAGILTWSSFS